MPELPERFVAVFRDHYGDVVRQIMSLVHDKSTAEDIVQETFLRLYRNPPDDITKVGPWLYRVAMRIGYDHIRSRQREETIKQRPSDLTDMLQVEPSGEDMFVQQLDRDDVLRTLQRLSDRDRQVLLLRHSGYSYIEIAQVLGIHKNNVGTLLHRATHRFRQAYDGEDGIQHG